VNLAEIVTMTLEHIDGVMAVEKLSFTIPWSKNAFIEEITGNKFSRYVTAITENSVIGYAGMWKVFDEGHITNVAVHPEFRGSGVGSMLIEKLLEIAEKEEIKSLTLEVRKSNQAALCLYKKFGFEVEGVRKAYYADNGEDAIIMWKK
jgi:[ribosomal protein S18]-alanine N-acetyltransferase